MRSLSVVILLSLAPLCVAEFRSFDGTGNNETHTHWGAAETGFSRVVPANFEDATGEVLRQTPNPRLVSNDLSKQVGSIPNARHLTSMVWQWGQFLDHDITLSKNGPGYGAATIMAPSPDPDDMRMIPFNRTQFDPATGGATGLPRKQINSISSYIDASNVYGSDEDRAAALRTFQGGKLKTSGSGLGLLPTNNLDGSLGALFNDDGGIGASVLFVAGDIRANEQPGLTALHTIFVREHNRIADELRDVHAWDDERLYQTTRRIVGAQIQAITYNEFLPAVLGADSPDVVSRMGYRADVDATVTNEFATVFFRFGHSMLDEDLLMIDDGGSLHDSMRLRDVFFRPEVIINAVDPDAVLDDLLMGLTKQVAQEVDGKIVDGVRSFLFAPSGDIGLDLAALNIQRGRDHGLPNYNTMRSAYGLSPAADFADVTTDVAAQDSLALLYDDVGELDAWVGALVEDHVDGASFGPLIQASLIDQFERLRDGDRFFYTHDPELSLEEYSTSIDLSDVRISGMANNAFVVPEPSTVLMSFLGLISIARFRPRRKQNGS